MRSLLIFITGMFVGAIAALLVSPGRGDDLRMQLQERAGRDLNRMQRMWKEDVAKMSDQLSSLQRQLIELRQQADVQMAISLDEDVDN
jgi:gas vesicle protein